MPQLSSELFFIIWFDLDHFLENFEFHPRNPPNHTIFSGKIAYRDPYFGCRPPPICIFKNRSTVNTQLILLEIESPTMLEFGKNNLMAIGSVVRFLDDFEFQKHPIFCVVDPPPWSNVGKCPKKSVAFLGTTMLIFEKVQNFIKFGLSEKYMAYGVISNQ